MQANHSIVEVKRVVNLRDLAEAEGVELQPAGPGRLRGFCLFHQEKTPSFFIYDGVRFHCYGCGAHGDAIDFVRRARGCGYRDALRILGADDARPTAAELARIRTERRQREALAWRERELAWTLGAAIRLTRRALERITPENFDSPDFALILSELSTLEYQHGLIVNGDGADKAALVEELRGLRLLTRRLLFRRDFDFAAWARSLGRDQEPHHGRRSTGAPSHPGGTSPGAASV